MKTLELEVVTPHRGLEPGRVRSLVVPTEDGHLGILPDHAPLMCVLGIGPARFVDEQGGEGGLMVDGGFLEVSRNKVRILANVAELPEEIDVERARAAEERARRRLRERAESAFDLVRAETALQRALARQKLVSDLPAGRRRR